MPMNATLMYAMYVTSMYVSLMYVMYVTPIERIVGDTAKVLDEKGALEGNITRTGLRSTVEDCVSKASGGNVRKKDRSSHSS